MTTYFVTYVDSKGGTDLTTLVEADGVEKDPHWVTFYAEAPREADVFGGCECSPRKAVRSFPGKKSVVALYPSGRIRSVQVSDNVDH